jgi:hypothetical protein
VSMIYRSPVAVPRPYGSYRYDVFSTKAKRRLTLYGEAALMAYVDLEADPLVTDLCERPLIIDDSKPRRVVDFWALKHGQVHYYLLLRGKETAEKLLARAAVADFVYWAEQAKAKVVTIDPAALKSRRYRYYNLAHMLQCVSVYGTHIEHSVRPKALSQLPTNFNLEEGAHAVFPEEPAIGRSLIFRELIEGRLTCQNLNDFALGNSTHFSKKF